MPMARMARWRTGLLGLVLLGLPAVAGANAAVEALLDSAAAHVVAGDPDRAASDLERALRIEPRNPAIWHDLGQVRLHQGRYRDAITLAERSNGLAGEDAELHARNAHLIATARALAGDPPVQTVDASPRLPDPVRPDPVRPDPVLSVPAVPVDPAHTVTEPVAPARTAEVDPYMPPPPWYQPPPAFAEPTLAPIPDFAQLALAMLPTLLGVDPGYPEPAYRDPYYRHQRGYPESYQPPSELHLELAPGLGITVRLPERGGNIDPLAAGLLEAVIGAVGARAVRGPEPRGREWHPSRQHGPPPWAGRGRGRD